MKLIKIGALVFILSLASYQHALAQVVVHTKAAQVVVKVWHHDHVASYWSDKLNIYLDYANASFTAFLRTTDIYSSDPLLMDELKLILIDKFEISGKFGMENIETTKHEPITFGFRGHLNYGNTRLPITGYGKLEHIDGGSIACLLDFAFDLDKAILPIALAQEHDVENINIEVLQSVLKIEDY